MKSTSVRGTPVNSIKAGNTQGMRAGKPSGMSGVVNKQYEGEQSTNRANGNTGTPYNSQDGNGPETRNVRSQGKYGINNANGQGDMNSPDSNGDGVILDDMSQSTGYSPRAADAMDSPVMAGAPTFDPRTIEQENVAHLGNGADPAQARDRLLDIGGVMSRGMAGVSKPNQSITALVEDDVLRNLGSGGAEG